jgi:hypothetical protein
MTTARTDSGRCRQAPISSRRSLARRGQSIAAA